MPDLVRRTTAFLFEHYMRTEGSHVAWTELQSRYKRSIIAAFRREGAPNLTVKRLNRYVVGLRALYKWYVKNVNEVVIVGFSQSKVVNDTKIVVENIPALMMDKSGSGLHAVVALPAELPDAVRDLYLEGVLYLSGSPKIQKVTNLSIHESSFLATTLRREEGPSDDLSLLFSSFAHGIKDPSLLTRNILGCKTCPYSGFCTKAAC